MKINATLIFSAICVILISISAINIPNIDKGFIKFNKKLFAARYEVTNKEYRKFLQSLKSDKKYDMFSKCLYDSTQWTKKFPYSYCEPMVNTYHSHPAYDNYPVVNISLDAAKSYCEWLTVKYNSDSKKTYKKVLIRLPTETEWEMLADPLPGHNLPWYGNYPYVDENGKTFLANIKIKDMVTGNDDYSIDGGVFTLIVGHYKPNNLGINDVVGNVCEMTSDGKLKGGSWDNYLDECTIEKTQTFTMPDPRVGFRIIMEVIEE